VPRFADLGWFSQGIRRVALDEVLVHPDSTDPRSILLEHPKLVVAANHGAAYGPLAAVAGYMTLMQELGMRERSYFGVTWRGLYRTPGVRQFARFVGQTDGVRSAAEYARLLREGPHHDFIVMPEGDNCLFGDGLRVQPFLSHGFVEVAVRAQVPILIATHQGSEAWAAHIRVGRQASGRFMDPLARAPGGVGHVLRRWSHRLRETEQITVWNPLKGRLPRLNLHFQLYRPSLTLDQLADDRMERRAQLMADGEEVRARMIGAVERMAGLAPPA
jgi:hypothetical protein